ncbi:MAB_1171c family putative transporter [Streptomyces sp. NRRL WC-3742]|uniref:MAB_1171c family putative transporter n=1 Tax=Streptomyces sp. NRRL WC-3742 TaxID=1463934 RepID=UPI0004C8D6DA|nr:MAB_1171c family putative transporter [Streptomyces sp. NRRL WC-3742]
MRPIDLGLLPVVWIPTLWSLRKLRGAPRRTRLLWGVWASWAVSMTVGVPAIRRLIDAATGVASGTNLLVHVSGLVATAIMLEFVREMTGRSQGRASRLNLAGLAVAAVALTVTFAVMPRPDGEVVLLTYGERSLAGYLYWMVLTVDTAIGLTASAVLCWVHGRHASPGPVRTALWLMRASSAIGMAYLAHRAYFLTVRHIGWKVGEPAAVAGTTQVLMVLTMLLFALAVVWPSLAEHREKRAAARRVRRIHPLWQLLQAATPEVVLPLPDELRRNNPGLRLYRQVIEIRDSMLALDRHLGPAHTAAAEEHLRAAGLSGERLAVAAEAVLLKHAVAAELAGCSAEFSGQQWRLRADGLDLDAEIAWFAKVAAKVAAPEVDAAAEHLWSSPGAPAVGAPGEDLVG